MNYEDIELNESQLDTRIQYLFLDKYEKLYNQNKISEKQLQKVINLIENFRDYSKGEFQDRLKKIFNNKEARNEKNSNS